uniref:Uncharacterized protein n=1 Tax=Acrobeloides nanus TaxID=290746 RepID=A0A914EF60_9BILA
MAIEAYRNFLFELIGDLFKSSIIVYKQPPAIVTMFETRASTKKSNDVNKNGESKKSSRNSQFSFDTEICLLGEQFWYQSYGVIAEVKCEVNLLTENDDGEQKFTIQPSSVGFCPPDPKDPKMIRSIHNIAKSTAFFPNMKILKVEKRPHGVKNRRYAIRYEMASPFGNIRKLSLPFAIVNGKPDLEIDTLLFMERSFANLCIQIVNMGTVMMEGHNSTFDDYHKSLTRDLRQMNIENNRVIEALELKFRDKKHLLQILENPIPKHLAEKGRECKCYQCECRKNGHEIVHGKISLSSIIDHIVCMKFVTNSGKICLQDSTFNEWFYKVAEIVGVLKKHWNSGEIFGFCDQTVAEALVLAKPDRILIRFADTMQGQLRLSMADSKTPQKYTLQGEEKERPKVRHITIKYAENLNSVNPESFNNDQQFYNLIKTAAKLYNINHIYEDFKIDLENGFEEEEEEANLLTSEYNKDTYSLTKNSDLLPIISQGLIPIILQGLIPIIPQYLIPIILQDLLPIIPQGLIPIILQDLCRLSSRPYSNNSSGPYSN